MFRDECRRPAGFVGKGRFLGQWEGLFHRPPNMFAHIGAAVKGFAYAPSLLVREGKGRWLVMSQLDVVMEASFLGLPNPCCEGRGTASVVWPTRVAVSAAFPPLPGAAGLVPQFLGGEGFGWFPASI